ncbi:SemiSWEET transporter [Bacillus sp. sid0103]|uniref:SemiSWEET transporter n=1 Tax=Bacillus sp. sid0103 TaxID=2856337 RepID=UPI001C487607|nr:SemiSWEET transporter [Bacillus sp. sid0103]MBV7508364.1 SemiSWEET transporter [Bacillus sp. sid0103]
MDFISVIGYIAAILTTVSFLPQAIKTIKDKNTDGISLGMYSMFTSGVLLWLVYGFFVKDIPIIIANSITFILAVTILALTIKYSTKVNQK